MNKETDPVSVDRHRVILIRMHVKIEQVLASVTQLVVRCPIHQEAISSWSEHMPWLLVRSAVGCHAEGSQLMFDSHIAISLKTFFKNGTKERQNPSCGQ